MARIEVPGKGGIGGLYNSTTSIPGKMMDLFGEWGTIAMYGTVAIVGVIGVIIVMKVF